MNIKNPSKCAQKYSGQNKTDLKHFYTFPAKLWPKHPKNARKPDFRRMGAHIGGVILIPQPGALDSNYGFPGGVMKEKF